MPDDLYRDDILTWSLEQAARLRRARAGERVNDLDWDNIIEEIETLGRSETEAVRSLLAQSILHLLKRRAWPTSSAMRKWHNDAADFLVQAQRMYRPSMAQRMELDDVLDYAVRRFRILDYATPALRLPPISPIPLDAVARDDFTLEKLEAALFPPG
jgi:hypothetical protein